MAKKFLQHFFIGGWIVLFSPGFFVSSGEATTYYVRKSGQDADSGVGPNIAFRTITKAASVVIAGDTVYVGAGIYTEGNINPASSGTASQPISFIADMSGAYTGYAGMVILDGTGLSDHTEGISIENRSNIIFDGFEIQNYGGSGVTFLQSSFLTFQNLKVHDNLTHGINSASSPVDQSHITIRDCEVYRNGDAPGEHGLRLRTGIQSTVSNVNVWENFDRGMSWEWKDSTGLDLLVHNNGFGLHTGNAGNMFTNILVYNNFGDGVQFASSQNALSHATIYGNRRDGFQSLSGTRGNSLMNSIIAHNGSDEADAGITDSSGGGLRHTHNVVFGNFATNFKGTTAHTSESVSDPLFIDPNGADEILGGAQASDDDFRLSQTAAGQTSTSPAVDTGSQTAVAAGLDTKTTRVDGVPDAGIVDRGYHSPLIPLSTAPQGILENPQEGTFQSGVGLLLGWVCEANRIEIEIDGTLTLEAAYGTSREDTRAMCGDADNGFGLLMNWNLLGDGTHVVRALADGHEFGMATFQITTLGTEFLKGAEGTFVLEDFPEVGMKVTIQWQEGLQNFVIIDRQGGAE